MTHFMSAVCKRFKQVDCKLCKLYRLRTIKKSDPRIIKLLEERHILMQQLLKLKMYIW